MRGTVIKRGSKWTICYYIGKDENGKWKQKWESGFASKRDAERALRARIETVESSYGSNLTTATVAGFLRYWLTNYCEPRLASNTIRGYRTNVERHIIPYIGKIPMIRLSPKDIQDLYLKLLKSGLSGTTVRYVHNNLHQALEFGVKLQALPRNPASMVAPPRIDHFEASTLTPNQVLRLLAVCHGTDIYWPVLLAVTLGLRRGEALGLRWSDVDFDRKEVFIRHSALCESLSKFTIAETKTKSSRRILRMPDFVARSLKERYDFMMEKRATIASSYNTYNVVCFRERGIPFTTNVLRHQFNKALSTAELPEIRFHDLRHTAATFLLRCHTPARVISSMLGHSNISVTMDTYSHVSTDMQEHAVSALDEMLANAE